MVWHDPTHQPTIHQTIHPTEISMNFKSSNRIEVSQFIQVLSHLNWFGVPLGGGWIWVGVDVCGWYPMHAWMCMHTYMHMTSYRFPHGSAICMKLSFLKHMHVQACTCVHINACVCMHGTPLHRRTPTSTHIHPSHPPPRAGPPNQ